MDHGEKEHIISNLSEFIETICVNTPLLAEMVQGRILSKADKIEIDRCHDGDKSLKFIEILQTRVGSYKTLIRVLKKYEQTGAVQILESYQKDETFEEEVNFVVNSRSPQSFERNSSENMCARFRCRACICVIILILFLALVAYLALTNMSLWNDDSLNRTSNLITNNTSNGSQTVLFDNDMYIYNFSR